MSNKPNIEPKPATPQTLEGALEEVRRLKNQVREQKETIDEADRRAGAAERKMESLRDSANARKSWLSRAKKEAGYDDSVSFDKVWKEALAALLRQRVEAGAEPLVDGVRRDQIRYALNVLSTIQDAERERSDEDSHVEGFMARTVFDQEFVKLVGRLQKLDNKLLEGMARNNRGDKPRG